MRPRRALCALLFFSSLLAAAETTVIDASGRVTAMIYSGEEAAIRTNLVVPTPGWQRQPGFPPADRVTVTRSDNVSTWQGTIEIAPGQALRFTQTASERDGKTRLAIEYSAVGDIAAEGIFLRIDLPRGDFAGGRAEFGDPSRSVILPQVKPARPDLISGDVASLVFRDAAANLTWTAALQPSRFVNLQDKGDERPPSYTLWVYLQRGSVPANTRGRFEIELAIAGQPDTTSAQLTLDASRRRYRFHGFGGNYCFNIESPVTQYTLDNLRVGWARTEMTLTEWEPENDNASPYDTDWPVLAARDRPGSNLRREFELAQQIQRRGIPYVISIWRLPEWLYTDPGQKTPSDARRRVDPAKWDELLESIGSYLLYARDAYGVEPDLFSFNEPNIGIYVLFDPQEHREAIKSIGAHLEGLGLKTRMLLGDVHAPRGTRAYTQAAAADPEAMRYVGAVGFHSWGGTTPEEYQGWGELAESLQLPLLVAELGVNASAWQGRSYDLFHYGIAELRMYQELLLHARPQGTMYWEFTSDYSLVRVSRNAAGQQELEPTARFFFTKQFTDLTPAYSDALSTSSDHPKALFTAFASEVGYTLHIANLGAAREATLFGIPEGIGRLRAIRTSESEQFLELPEEVPQAGALRLVLPARSLLTLTSW